MILIPDDLAAAERQWREDAEAQLAAVEHYLREAATAQFESDPPTSYQLAHRRAFEGMRDWLKARLSGKTEYLTNDMRKHLHAAAEMSWRSLKSQVARWRFGELTGREALHADCVRELRVAGPGYGYEWRKRLLDRYDAVTAAS
jgi:hypothetical protein